LTLRDKAHWLVVSLPPPRIPTGGAVFFVSKTVDAMIVPRIHRNSGDAKSMPLCNKKRWNFPIIKRFPQEKEEIKH
jgi:hypothetical protein